MITMFSNTVAPNGQQEASPLYAISNFCDGIARMAKNLELNPSDAVAVVEVIMLGMADAAKERKSKEGPIAIIIDDLKGYPVLSLKVTPTEPTEEEPEGAWEPLFGFGPECIEDVPKEKMYKLSEAKTHISFINKAKSYGFTFSDTTTIYIAVINFAECIFNYLDFAAVEGDTVEITHPNFFTAAVKIEDGKKILSFTADEEVTNIIKDKAINS